MDLSATVHQQGRSFYPDSVEGQPVSAPIRPKHIESLSGGVTHRVQGPGHSSARNRLRQSARHEDAGCSSPRLPS